jgi:hypothetical protein
VLKLFDPSFHQSIIADT